ncbi:Hypothetical protein NCS54_01196000 [Fusarium falciforme]|uniref:Hypothetical protein n=1 Tax=Fusarium falciforme TaxID=195108 RepID=UPI002300FEBE|nr:Hypothetical protein NCS54_01196000 [Fusarium falciforme]WAO94379.1 Hypothetical protein NCS54_01196000 [Fusarium falciforme]
MLGNCLLLAATAAISFLPSLVHAAPAPIVERREDGSVAIGIEHTDDNGNVLGKRNVVLQDFIGCGDWKEDIIAAWESMLSMGALIKDKMDFNEPVAKDYLGDPSRNKGSQDAIKKLIQSVVTWRLGEGVLDWKLQMRCDDINRKIAAIGATFPQGCPTNPGAREDKDQYYKCESACWKYRQFGGGWVHNAMAYTQGRGNGKNVGYINLCPGWFKLRTCGDAASAYSIHPDPDYKYNIINYLCREQALVHELFHIDANWKQHVPGHGHIGDTQIQILVQDKYYDRRDAYGVYAKLMATSAGKKHDVGRLVSTNADNLALYFLGKWVQQKYGVYPNQPFPTVKLVGIVEGKNRKKRDDASIDETYDTPDVWDPFVAVDGNVGLGDLNDLAVALGVESKEEAKTLYSDDDDTGTCLDFEAQDGDDEIPVCSDRGEVVELEATEDSLEAGPVEPIPAGPDRNGPDAEVVTTDNADAAPTGIQLPGGPDPNGPDAEVVTAGDPEPVPTADVVDAITAGLGGAFPAGPDAEVVTQNAEPAPTEGNLPEGSDPNGPDAEVVPNQGAQVIPNKGAHSSIPSNSTAYE